MKKYDYILIGTGQATGTLMGEWSQTDKKVAIIEGDRVGGTCVNWGCTPTKTMVASARAAHMVHRAADFGVNIKGDVEIDFARVMERQNAIRNGNSDNMAAWLDDISDLYRGHAQFKSEHTVRVGDEVIEGEFIYIHTGGRARVPNIPGLDEVDYLTNKELLALTELPEHLVIVGGSYIGLEFGQMFRRFGSEVTVLQRGDQLMPREDADIATIAKDVLEGEGMNIVLNANVKRMSKTSSGGVQVTAERDGNDETFSGSHLLLAVGRVPNSDKLNLEAAGVETDERGFIKVNDHLQTNVPHIYAVGDVNGQGAFTHTSVNDGEIILNNQKGGDRGVSDRILTYAMFIDPPLGRVGMNEKMAKQSDRKMMMGVMEMASIARAKEKDETAGRVKVIVDAETDQFMGATVFGTGGDEIVNMFTVAMYTGVPCRTFRDSVLIHPTVAELLPYIIRDMEPVN